MSSSSTSNDAKPSSDSASDPYAHRTVAYTADGRPIRVKNMEPWRMAPGTWAEQARIC